jgi:hypothetical protein
MRWVSQNHDIRRMDHDQLSEYNDGSNNWIQISQEYDTVLYQVSSRPGDHRKVWCMHENELQTTLFLTCHHHFLKYPQQNDQRFLVTERKAVAQ